MGIATNEVNANSHGGTELSIRELGSRIPENIMEHFHIIPSRFRGHAPNKISIYWAHDLPGDPECDHLKQGGYNQYERLVFVSNWQMQAFISYYQIPWRKCVVIPNAIVPISMRDRLHNGVRARDTIRLIYHTTPHRGLQILVPVFEELCKTYDNIELDVFSSFKIYGWPERDAQFEELFERCRQHPKIKYQGFAEQSIVREAIQQADIFAYPSTWMETGCRSLMEAMSAGLLCVHSNYGCLAETAAGWTWMYQYHENPRDHANFFYQHLRSAIDNFWHEDIQLRISGQASYSHVFHNWEMRRVQWQTLLEEILRAKGIKYDRS